MSGRAQLIADRMLARLDRILKVVPPIAPPVAHWLDSDGAASYCWKCAHIARGAEFDLGSPVKPHAWYERQDDWVEAFYDGIDGGFDTTSDSPASCSICYRTLSYILTDYGVDNELSYYLESPLIVVRDEDSYALDRLCLNVWDGSARAQLLAASAVVAQAYRLLPTPVEPEEETISGYPAPSV